jgi:DNA modification methylase/ParB-like chromosome segregation protein Spo0J
MSDETRISLGDLVEDPLNARKHTARNLQSIEESLQRAGAGRSILAARDKDGRLVILAGNATTEAAMSAGFENARIVEADGTELIVVVRNDLAPDDPQARLLALADNRVAELASWDVPVLASLPTDLLDMFFTPQEMGRLLQTMDKQISEVTGDEGPPTGETAELATDDPEAGPDGAGAEEDSQETTAKTGDVWCLGEHLLWCGESDHPDTRSALAVLQHDRGQHPAIIVTDPPYGIDYKDIRAGRRNQKAEDWESIESDDDDPASVEDLETLIFNALSEVPARTAVIWHPPLQNRLAFWRAMEKDFWKLRQELIWVKDSFVFGRADYHWQHEVASLFAKKGHYSSMNRTLSTVINAPKPSKAVHPTQKPIVCYSTPILHHTSQGEVLYDPFAGSGTAAIACEDTGRIAHMVEMSPAYCDLIITRWQKHTGKVATKL